jgi:hypothetical protein
VFRVLVVRVNAHCWLRAVRLSRVRGDTYELYELAKGKGAELGIRKRFARAKRQSGPSEKEVFQSPSLLADWVNRFILQGKPLEDDYKLLPDDETRKNLNITIEQRERCVSEYSLLRIAGVSTFVKQHYPDDFWLAFSKRVVPHLCRHMYGSGGGRELEVAKALEEYVDATASKDVDRCSDAYLLRVYEDSDNFFQLKLAGVGFISAKFIVSTFEVFRDAYCRVTKGFSYESLKAVTIAIEKIKATKA